MNDQAYVRFHNIVKKFGTVVANDSIDLDVQRGEILAILGENGSGKSTLMNMLSGIYMPDSGSITIDGKPAVIRSPKDSIKLGIGMIHQHFKLIDRFTGYQNIMTGITSNTLGYKKSVKKITELMDKYELHIDLDKYVYDMSVGEKQTLEIIKVMFRGAEVLILDEPTAVLTPEEITKLFVILRNMRKAGHAIIIITHKLNEVMEISDRVTVLRKGKNVGTLNTNQTNILELTELMVGRPMEPIIRRVECEPGDVYLSVEDVTAYNHEGIKVLDNISFELSSHEIVGVAGVAGSGQRELCEVIAGLYPVKKGSVSCMNQEIVGKTPGEIIKMGVSMSFIPEDRLGMGLVSSMDITDNMLLKTYRDGKGLFINRNPAREMARNIVKKMDIVTPGISTPVSKLSGGNIQKVLLGREIESNPKVLVTAYAVRGLDIGASYTIYDMLNKQKEKGVAVLYIGEDLDTLIQLCDRIIVMFSGKIAGIVDARNATKEQLGLMMTGKVMMYV
ncbi:MAG TPA: ABC transporter ATP-binding protein [Clostridiales bacterium]|nr:ABC transporter ATP-binding protein [Clostridiales bacterium]